MKIFIPFRLVEAPELTEEQIAKLIEGRYVEGEFGLEEGDVFLLRGVLAVCYRIMDDGMRRVREYLRRGWSDKRTGGRMSLPHRCLLSFMDSY